MAFVVEDGTGKTDANSYAEVADADAYFAERKITTWTGADDVKQAALIKATDYIDGRFGSRFKGMPEFIEQALAWPRLYAYAPSGITYAGIPSALKKACFEYALRTLAGDLAPDPTSANSAVQSEEKTVGPITVKKAYVTTGQKAELFKPYPAADMLLRPLLLPGGVVR